MSKECTHPGCTREQYRIGYCTTHRNRFRLGKDMDAPFRGAIPPEDLFWAKVDKGADDECWEWLAARSVEGYGNFGLNGKWLRAHRISYEWHYGPIPPGIQVDHACLNTGCVNPRHLRLATNALNCQNRSGPYSNGASGVRGVSWNKKENRWTAYATLNWKRTWIGSFHLLEDAEAAVIAWRREHMPYSVMDQRSTT